MGQRQRATTADAVRAEKLREAWQMRIDGHTEEQIARRFRVTQSTISKWLHEAYEKRTAPVAAELKAVELDKLDQAERAVLEVLRRRHVLVSGGRIVRRTEVDEEGNEVPTDEELVDDAPVLSAVDRLVKIATRRAALLGIDAPTKVDTTGQVAIQHTVIGADPDQV